MTTPTTGTRSPPAQPPPTRRHRLAKMAAIPALALGLIALAGCGTTTTITPAAASSSRPAAATTTPAARPTVTRTVTAAPATTAPASATPAYAPVAADPPTSIVSAEAVVTQFYQDITDQDYQAAWALGGDNVSSGVGYQAWVAGYATTASMTLGTFSYWGSDQVQVEITALQSDGSVNTYTGAYTVGNSVITSANIAQTS
jgi:hypothetical protein